jgi:hypothetical protein
MSAIPASTVNLKTMSDGTLRISFDIEPAHAKDAFGLFAAPGTPVGIAALRVGYAAVPAPEKPKGGALARLAGQWCKEPAFQKWVTAAYDRAMGGDGTRRGDINPGDLDPDTPEAFARHAILVMCGGIQSRAELDGDINAAALFKRLIRTPYMEFTATQPRTIG